MIAILTWACVAVATVGLAIALWDVRRRPDAMIDGLIAEKGARRGLCR